MACWNMLIQLDDFPISTPFILIEGSLEVKLPTIWTDEKQRWMKSRDGKSQRREEKKEDQRRERVRGKKMQLREKVEKSRFTSFFSNDLWLQRVKK
jgi:hypothetical protein